MPSSDQLEFHRDGAELVRGAVSPPEFFQLRKDLEAESGAGGRQPGRRSFTPMESVRWLIGADGPLGSLAAALCGRPSRSVRILIFDKTVETNWAVGWHQDRTIAVRQAADVDGYGIWTTKQGVCHVEPPEALLANMVTLRLHLDDCGAENGALQILPGTHRLGRIGSDQSGSARSRPEALKAAGRHMSVPLRRAMSWPCGF